MTIRKLAFSLFFTLTSLAVAHASLAAPDLVLTVGADADCDHSDIAHAYAAVPVSTNIREVEIRVKVGEYPETRLLIPDLAAHPEGFQLTVRGGYVSCSAATSSNVSTSPTR